MTKSSRAERLLADSEELLRAAGSSLNLTINLTIRAIATAMGDDTSLQGAVEQ
jgi:hypothetical protein